MSQLRRALLVTLGLSITGGVFGAFAGVVALFLGIASSEGFEAAMDPFGYINGAMFGAACGAMAAPVFGWLVLRYVPLGRAIAWTTIGTVIGGAGGWILHVNPLLTALFGFAAASLLVRWYSRRRMQNEMANEPV